MEKALFHGTDKDKLSYRAFTTYWYGAKHFIHFLNLTLSVPK